MLYVSVGDMVPADDPVPAGTTSPVVLVCL